MTSTGTNNRVLQIDARATRPYIAGGTKNLPRIPASEFKYMVTATVTTKRQGAVLRVVHERRLAVEKTESLAKEAARFMQNALYTQFDRVTLKTKTILKEKRPLVASWAPPHDVVDTQYLSNITVVPITCNSRNETDVL